MITELSMKCPACAAAPGEPCELYGATATYSHIRRHFAFGDLLSYPTRTDRPVNG